MPCYEPRTSINEAAARDSIHILEARIDRLTDLLCKAGRARKNKTEIPSDVLSWWEKHCEEDRQRGEMW